MYHISLAREWHLELGSITKRDFFLFRNVACLCCFKTCYAVLEHVYADIEHLAVLEHAYAVLESGDNTFQDKFLLRKSSL